MNILDTAANLINQQLSTDVDADTLRSALSSLLGDGSGEVDLAGLSQRLMSEGGLGDVVQSWLGDGDNAPISPDAVRSVVGDGNMSEFASKLNIDPDAAGNGLAEMLPQLLDQASSGGQLLEQFGGAGGLLDAAKSLFK